MNQSNLTTGSWLTINVDYYYLNTSYLNKKLWLNLNKMHN